MSDYVTKLDPKHGDTPATLQTSTVQAGVGSAIGALLELKLVGEIKGRFFVARYQRGYRWGMIEVKRLLDDIWDSKGKDYCLQPVVVKHRLNNEWELVDGQQRLTTLYLIFRYMQLEGLKKYGPPYSITYETRPNSETYLQELDASQSKINIDFFHLYKAYDCIRNWFEDHGDSDQQRQHVADKFYGFLFESVRVIWYEAPPELDSTKLFTRLNIGRIPLTDAELVKALLLSDDSDDRAQELALQWDGFERDLRSPDIWSFVSDKKPDECPTRIDLLLDAIAGDPTERQRALFYTFDELRKKIESSSRKKVWEMVTDKHGLLMGWYENRDLYHKIGYLVAIGEPFADLVALAENSTKKGFDSQLDQLIRDKLKLTPAAVAELSYDNKTDKRKCEQILLLMNVETVRRIKESSERYPFHAHHSGAWSLEHIHAQHAEGLTKVEQWQEWLRLHREALVDLPIAKERRNAMLARIDSVIDKVDRLNFPQLASEVTELFTLEGDAQSMHSISNLALLSSGDNSALGKAVFEVKRRLILERDRKGSYIPICTRHVFLKYYTDANAQQIHFWGPQDRESYLQAMISQERGVIASYLQPEERQS